MLILASRSPRRKELLRILNIPFAVETADVREETSGEDLFSVPEKNALLKARAVSVRRPEDVVVGADTAIIFDGKLIGKPENLSAAAAMLGAFSGKTHIVVTAVAIVSAEKTLSYSERAEVTFKRLSAETIARYLAEVPVLDKAGAYAIQSHGDEIVESFSGEFETIVGLPLKRLSVVLPGMIK